MAKVKFRGVEEKRNRRLWALRDRVEERVKKRKPRRGTNGWHTAERIEAAWLKGYLKACELSLQVAARRPRGKTHHGGWNVNDRARRFRVDRGTRLRDYRYHPRNWPTDAEPRGQGVNAALTWGRRNLGRTEHPYGSNGGPGISSWQASFGFGRVPWCGIWDGMCLRAAGVGVTSRIASVGLIEGDAKAGHNGFKSWHGPGSGRAGDCVVLFGYGVHTGVIEKRVSGGYQTLEGNTSSANGGSQSNGGGSFRRFRSYGAVRGCARPRY